jgi:hypothetical protein
VNRGAKLHETRDHTVVVGAELERPALARGVDVGRLDSQQSDLGTGARYEVGDIPFGDQARAGTQVLFHRRHQYPVGD